MGSRIEFYLLLNNINEKYLFYYSNEYISNEALIFVNKIIIINLPKH